METIPNGKEEQTNVFPKDRKLFVYCLLIRIACYLVNEL